MSEKHFQITVVDRIGIFRHAGIDELFQFPFQTKAVHIHLQVIRNLSGF